MFELTFPRKVGNPNQKMVYSMKEFLDFVNANNGRCNLYTNAYNYDWLGKQSFSYQDIIIDKLFFDFDAEIRGRKVDAYANAVKIEEECYSENIPHINVMTSSNYATYVKVKPYKPKNPRACLKNAQLYFGTKLGLDIDPSIIGDVSQIARVIGTIGMKSRRYCISINREQLLKGDAFVKSLAVKLSNKVYVCNSAGEPFDVSCFDREPDNYNYDEIKVEKGAVTYDDLHVEELPECLRTLLSRDDLIWNDLCTEIGMLKENGFTRDETMNILFRQFTAHKEESVKKSHEFNHWLSYEVKRQVDYLYSNKTWIPTQETLRKSGLCPFSGVACSLAKRGCEKYVTRNNHSSIHVYSTFNRSALARDVLLAAAGAQIKLIHDEMVIKR